MKLRAPATLVLCAAATLLAPALAQSPAGQAAPAAGATTAPTCAPPPPDLVAQARREAPAIGQAMMNTLSSRHCGSLLRTLAQLFRRTTGGGRGLLPEGPQALAEAQAELATARADPRFQEALAGELAGETDPVIRQVKEAVVLGVFDYTKARSLVLQGLMAGRS